MARKIQLKGKHLLSNVPMSEDVYPVTKTEYVKNGNTTLNDSIDTINTSIDTINTNIINLTNNANTSEIIIENLEDSDFNIFDTISHTEDKRIKNQIIKILHTDRCERITINDYWPGYEIVLIISTENAISIVVDDKIVPNYFSIVESLSLEAGYSRLTISKDGVINIEQLYTIN